jgi:hypothetical protein
MLVYITKEDFNKAKVDKDYVAEYYLSIGLLYVYEGDGVEYVEIEVDEV